jgi:hypothetical protein
MNIKQVAVSIAALTILAGAPALAFAQTSVQGNPIAVSAVNVEPSIHGDGPGSITVNYQNTSNATATEVVFELDVDGALVDTFYDTGSFAPGVAIKHTFTTDTDASNAQIQVAQVTFADGQVWASGN